MCEFSLLLLLLVVVLLLTIVLLVLLAVVLVAAALTIDFYSQFIGCYQLVLQLLNIMR